MALRFFADHCVSNQIIAALQEAGHEVIRLKDVLPTESADGLVAAKAQQLDAILLSLNGDFADIVTYPPAQFKSIVALQVLNRPQATPALIVKLVAFLLTHPSQPYYAGKLIIVEPHRVRVRV
jgi:predicted nuclease of predicted toxin-antitoxin system